jgi:hypothetical protein
MVVGISPEGRELFRNRIDPSTPVLDIKDGPLIVVTFLAHDGPEIMLPCITDPAHGTCTPPTGSPPPPCDPGGN